ISAKLEVLKQIDYLHDQERRAVRELPEGSTRQPGEALSTDEIEAIKDKQLVGVHTTFTAPYVMDQKSGLSIIRSTEGFNRHTPDCSPRSSIRWSLKHPVVSHISGKFGVRGYTIVAPLYGLAAANGAPAVMYGVDSYFTLDPGAGLIIPPEAVTIAIEG